MVTQRAHPTENERPMRREDYERLIDSEVWAFVRRTDEWFPPETIGLPTERQREIYDAMCRAFHAGRPTDVATQDLTMDVAGRSLPARRYLRAGTSPSATIVYYHGGGFILGGLDSHDDICAELCAGTGYDVVSVDYRLAPEHLHPAAFDDAVAVFTWAAAANDLPIVLCGESAGANLAAGLAIRALGEALPGIAGQVLVYPALGGDLQKGSYVDQRRYISDPPPGYRTVDDPAKLDDVGEPELKKQKKRKKEAAVANTGKQWWNFLQ